MEDTNIAEPISERSESGLAELKQKYDRLILKVCRSILKSPEDAEECANDTLLAVWESLSREKPNDPVAFICKIARRKALNRLRYNTAPIRNSDLLTELDEIAECVPSEVDSPEEYAERAEFTAALNEWLGTLPEKQRVLFIRRYFFSDSVKEAAKLCRMSANAAGAAAVNKNSTLYIGNEFAFNMELKKYDITIPEEYMPTEENKNNYPNKVDIGVVELFGKFNAPLLITDKFSTEVDTQVGDIERWNLRNTDREKPYIHVFRDRVSFDYYLYSKSLDMNINFYAFYLTKDADSKYGHHDTLGYDFPPMEIIRLRDGSSCAVCEGFAEFSFNGAIYRFFIESDECTLEMTMQVLEDLEVL